ncbi:MAG: hypothetical protein P4L67_04565 [Candidatus Pacebacteria bacterium]|nr:hypothetical protein [Candidatus Paceibacterota bacterium]
MADNPNKPSTEEIRERLQKSASESQGSVGKQTIRSRRKNTWTDEQTAILGTMPDYKVAAKLGLTVSVVYNRRCKMRIPTCWNDKAYSGDAPADSDWTQEEDDLLGTHRDHVIAGKLGRSLGDVQKRRASLGIPGYDKPVERPVHESVSQDARVALDRIIELVEEIKDRSEAIEYAAKAVVDYLESQSDH